MAVKRKASKKDLASAFGILKGHGNELMEELRKLEEEEAKHEEEDFKNFLKKGKKPLRFV